MRRPLVALAFISAICLSLSAPGWAQNIETAPVSSKTLHFLESKPLELAKTLPLPPEAGSLAALADLEAVMQAQAWRTPEQVAWAILIDKVDVYHFALVLGPWFTAKNLPLSEHFFQETFEDLRQVSPAVKKRFARPRPPKVDSRILPCVNLPKSGSYPSGHSLYLFVEAGVLAEIFPEHREALFAHAHRSAWGRIFAGVHFPSDVVAGRMLAEILIKEMKGNEAFRRAVEACRKEADPFLIKKAA